MRNMDSLAERNCLYPTQPSSRSSHPADPSLERAIALLNMEPMLPLCLLPLSARHFPPLPVHCPYVQGEGVGVLVLLIRESLASRKWLLLLTSAESGYPDVVRRQEVSDALLTIGWLGEYPRGVLFFQACSVVGFRNSVFFHPSCHTVRLLSAVDLRSVRVEAVPWRR